MNLDDWLQRSEHGPGLLNALEAKPDDPLTRLIMADALDEAGFTGAAKGMRWAAKHGKRPMRAGEHHPSNLGGWTRLSTFDYPNQFDSRNPYTPHLLPNAFFRQKLPLMDSDTTLQKPHSIWYRTARNGTRWNERDFLHASNQVQWDDNGEPIDDKQGA